MYEAFFGLCERAFDPSPNPRSLSLTGGQREVLSKLESAIALRRGLILLTGAAGVGKTTLVNMLLQAKWERNVRTLYLSASRLSRSEFLEFLARSFELSREAHTSRIALLAELVPVLLRRHPSGGTTVLVVDDAQRLPYEMLEELRLLSNVSADTSRLLQIILAGRPELEPRLHESSLRPLKPGALLRYDVRPLDARETATFVSDRIRTAGGDPAGVFSDCAIRAIYQYSRGIPGTISAVCETALLTAFAQDRRSVDGAAVDMVCRNVDLPSPAVDPASDQPRIDRRRRRTDSGVMRVRVEPAVVSAREPEAVATGGRTLFAAVARPARRRFAFLSLRRVRSS